MGKKGLSDAASSATDMLFSDVSGADAGRTVTAKKSGEKKGFSFRGPAEEVPRWRLYADAAGMKVDDLGTVAMEEYIRNHPLSEEQQQIFDYKERMKS